MRFHESTAFFLASAAAGVGALSVDKENTTITKQTAQDIASGLLTKYYHGDEAAQSPGLFTDHYWWEAGSVWDSLVRYAALTGDTQFNDEVATALQFQVGSDGDYMPANQTTSLGNDDQSIWALAAMTAAERSFPVPDGATDWIDLATAVFEDQVGRWDADTCGGGLRWQVYLFESGYDAKNSATNAQFFQLAARLALFTGNQTYADWAEKTYAWAETVGLITDDYDVYDVTTTTDNCSSITKLQWSYIPAAFSYGASVMWNMTDGATGGDEWYNRTQGFVDSMSTFTSSDNGTKNVLYEAACASDSDSDCRTVFVPYKGMAARWLSDTARVAPWTADSIDPILQASAQAAAQRCGTSATNSTVLCSGPSWVSSTNSTTGLEQQMAALDAVLASLESVSTSGTTNASSSSSTSGSATTTTAASGSAASSPVATGAASGRGLSVESACMLGFAMALVFGLL